jgi:hypothetical protein
MHPDTPGLDSLKEQLERGNFGDAQGALRPELN